MAYSRSYTWRARAATYAVSSAYGPKRRTSSSHIESPGRPSAIHSARYEPAAPPNTIPKMLKPAST